MTNDVIERMLNAAYQHSLDRDRMTAAAKVLLAEALGPVTDEEWYVAANKMHVEMFRRDEVDFALEKRRARLLPKSKPDAAVEAVAAILKGTMDTEAADRDYARAKAAQIVAAVREADKEQNQ